MSEFIKMKTNHTVPILIAVIIILAIALIYAVVSGGVTGKTIIQKCTSAQINECRTGGGTAIYSSELRGCYCVSGCTTTQCIMRPCGDYRGCRPK